MGVFDHIGDLLDTQEGQQGLSAVSALFEEEGGLNGLVEKLSSAGYSTTIQSWISKDENLAITPDQIRSVLGLHKIEGLADKVGVDPSTMSKSLAKILPATIDKLTPSGKLDASSQFLQQNLRFLKGKFF